MREHTDLENEQCERCSHTEYMHPINYNWPGDGFDIRDGQLVTHHTWTPESPEQGCTNCLWPFPEKTTATAVISSG